MATATRSNEAKTKTIMTPIEIWIGPFCLGLIVDKRYRPCSFPSSKKDGCWLESYTKPYERWLAPSVDEAKEAIRQLLPEAARSCVEFR